MDNLKNIILFFVLFGFFSVGFAEDALACKPGTSECVDIYSYHTCNEMALWNDAVSCTTGQICESGVCIQQQQVGCKPGTSECVSGVSYHTCSNYGIWNAEQSCAAGQTCSNGQCIGPTPQCSKYQQTKCNGNEVQICNAQLQWEHFKYCDYGCYNGYCRTCTPDSRRCTDTDSYQVCDIDGTWSSTRDCEKHYECKSGYCKISNSYKCDQPGQFRCQPNSFNQLQKCNTNRVWDDYRICDLGCSYGQCISCFHGQTKCYDSQSYLSCNDFGQWNSPVKCASNTVCNSGSCQVPQENKCSSLGQKRCSPTNTYMLQSCDGSAYVDYLKCDDGCIDGQCAQCKPGASFCAGANTYRVCTENGQLSNLKYCQEGYSCENHGQCILAPECSEGSKHCISDSIYACVNGSWSMLYHCPSEANCKETAGNAYCEQQASKNQSAKPDDVQPNQQTKEQINQITAIEFLLFLVTLILIAVIWNIYQRISKK